MCRSMHLKSTQPHRVTFALQSVSASSGRRTLFPTPVTLLLLRCTSVSYAVLQGLIIFFRGHIPLFKVDMHWIPSLKKRCFKKCATNAIRFWSGLLHVTVPNLVHPAEVAIEATPRLHDPN